MLHETCNSANTRQEECDENGEEKSVRRVFAREMDTDSRVGLERLSGEANVAGLEG